MKIKEMYMIFNNESKIKWQYFTTFGQAQCNRYGCISLSSLIDSLKGLVNSYLETQKEEDKILNTINGYRYVKKYETKTDNLYSSYYELVHTILTDEEIQKIQKSISYNFMSELFVNKMIELLESKEV